jgi:hypothetical protein
MKNFLIFILVLIISTIALEGFLKETRIAPPTLKYYNKDYGSLNRPDIDYFKSVEGFYIGKTNYDGRFRENYPKRKKDKKTLRILLVGDSFVEGIDVFSHNHFARYMEEILGKRLHRNVEILDFGRGNCSIQASSYFFINYIAKEYDGDIVLYFTEARDIYPTTEFPSTSYVLDSSNNLAASYNWMQTPEYKIHRVLSSNAVLKKYDESAYFRLLYRAVARIKISGMKVLTFGKFAGEAPEQDYSAYGIFANMSLLTQKIYDTIYKYNSGQVIFVVRNKPLWAPAIVDTMESKNYKYINLSDTFNDYFIKNTAVNAYYFKASNAYGGHWNNEGHKAVGAFLSNKILSQLDSYHMPDYEK